MKLEDICSVSVNLEVFIINFENQYTSKVRVFRHKRKDGTTFPVEISASVFMWRNKKLLRVVIRDITKQQKKDESVLLNLNLYHTILEEKPLIICQFLFNGEITFANNAFCEYMQKSWKNLIGKNFFNICQTLYHQEQ